MRFGQLGHQLTRKLPKTDQFGKPWKKKTIKCQFYGTPQGCSRGEACQYLHGDEKPKRLAKEYPMLSKFEYNENVTKDGKIKKCLIKEGEGPVMTKDSAVKSMNETLQIAYRI